MRPASRLVTIGLVVVVGAVAGGVGFASFVSTATITGSAGAGTLGPLVVTYLASVSGPGITVTSTLPTPTATFYFNGPFYPGQVANLSFTIKNTGTLPVLSPNLAYSNPSTVCDTDFSTTGVWGVPSSLAGGASFSGFWNITASMTPGCPGHTDTLVLSVTGTY